MNNDRFILSRSEGYDPQLIWSLTKHQRQKAQEKGTYENALFSALFGRALPPNTKMSSWLPPAVEENQQRKVESDEIRVLSSLRRNVPNTPIATLDMPGVADDYYTHSVALCGKNAAVILGGLCYLVSDIASRSRIIKEVFNRNDQTYGLACVEWINETTVAVGYRRSSALFTIDVTGQRAPKLQTALQHLVLGQLTRITRLSDTVFLTGYKNGEVVYNDASTGESRSLLGMRRNPEAVCAIVPSHNIKRVAVGYNDGSVNVYELTAQKAFALVRSYVSDISAGKRALAWLPNSETQFICGGGEQEPVLHVFNTTYPKAVAKYALPFRITNIVFADHRQFIATYGNRIGYFVLSQDKIKSIKEITVSSHHRLLDAVYNPQAGLITSSAGEFLNVWPAIPPKPRQGQSEGMKVVEIR